MKIRDNGPIFMGPEALTAWEQAQVALLPVPLELTTTYMQGTAQGPDALLEASQQFEYFDDELKKVTAHCGIATLEPLAFDGLTPEAATDHIQAVARELIATGKKPVFVGGEHSVSVGVIRAMAEAHPGLMVLHLDAHADYRDSYEDSSLNHACVMARVAEVAPFISMGIRSMEAEEYGRLKADGHPLFDIHFMRRQKDWQARILDKLKGPIYITLDLDVIDPSELPNVGTPEPGGMAWREVTAFMQRVFKEKRVVGLDVVELCPPAGPQYGILAASKLLYRLIGYWTE